MKNLFLTVACIFIYAGLFAQSQISIEATILDSVTKQPIPYANIGFIEKRIGTVSNEDGYFALTYNKFQINKNETLQISTLGYTTLNIQASELLELMSKGNKIYLKPKPLNLNEVLLTYEKRKERTIGTSSFNKKAKGYWYWRGKDALGGEIATRINIKKKSTKLLEFKFHIKENLSDSLMVRINVYNYVRKRNPKSNLLSKNIYHIISKKDGKETVNLRPYNINVNDDIVIGIELIEIYGDKLGFAITGNNYLGPSYTRYVSQDKWKRNLDNGVNFSVLTSVPSNKNDDFSLARNAPKKITLYWDTSLSMRDREVNAELSLLKQYLNKIRNTQIQVVKFNSVKENPIVFEISKGNSIQLQNHLRSSFYDGATNYNAILKENSFQAETILVFTDGVQDLEPLKQLIYVPAFYINSKANANHINLQKQANYGEGYYVNLLKETPKSALKLMRYEIEDKQVYSSNDKLSKNQLQGKVTNRDTLVIHGAIIKIKNSLVETISDKDGNYNINASQGDILVVEALGMLKKEIMVSETVLNIDLKRDGELLDEVIVTGRAEPKRTIKTAYGEKNYDAVGYDVYEITDEDITDANQTFDQVVSKLPGIIVSGEGANKRYSLSRSIGSSFMLDYNPIIVIDNIIYLQEDGLINLPPIDMQLVKIVRLLKSLASTNRYGSLGRNGAIIVETEASYSNVNNTSKPKSSALINGNDYMEDVLLRDRFTKSKYITQLEKAITFEDAKKEFILQRENFNFNTIPYFFDTSSYFFNWDKDFAFNILSNILVIAKNNPKALRTMAFKLEEENRFHDAKNIYEKITKLLPKQAQVYRDLALIYTKTGYYKEAMKLYGQMLNNSIDGVDFSGLQDIITNELKHLLANHRSKINYSNIHADYLQANFKYDMRIVFEWNDANTEFEVQFVNPQKKFFKWSQTKFYNKEKMLDGITKGYHTKEFIIDDDDDDDDDAGEWIINIESLNKEPELNPTYLKYTVFRNYGLANETKEVKIINLNECNPKITLDKLVNR